MAREEDDLDWEWFNEMYQNYNPETGVQLTPGEINYDMGDRTASAAAYRNAGQYGDPEYPWREVRPRAEYGAELRRQQKLANELRTGIDAYLPGGGFATDENTK